MIKTYYINENNDLLGILSVRAINVLKVRNKKELEDKQEEIINNIKTYGYMFYGKKTCIEFLDFFRINNIELKEEI